MAASTASSPTTKRILLADDSECVRSILRKILESQPTLQVCGEAEDGKDAIEQARQLKPDLILLDLAMPKLNGVETASILRQEFPDTPIVLLTVNENALGSIASTTGTGIPGVTAAISKHDGMPAVLACVQKLLNVSP